MGSFKEKLSELKKRNLKGNVRVKFWGDKDDEGKLIEVGEDYIIISDIHNNTIMYNLRHVISVETAKE